MCLCVDLPVTCVCVWTYLCLCVDIPVFVYGRTGVVCLYVDVPMTCLCVDIPVFVYGRTGVVCLYVDVPMTCLYVDIPVTCVCMWTYLSRVFVCGRTYDMFVCVLGVVHVPRPNHRVPRVSLCQL